MTVEPRLDRLEEGVGELLEAHEGADLERFEAYADDPVGFIEDVLGDELTAYQERIARAALENPLVTVRSCHAAGKDWLAARLALWWVYARDGLVILTGPTATQVEEILMRGEIRSAFHGSGLPGDLHVKALRPGGEGKAGILAKTATGVSALTGFHDARVLFVITEAQDPEIAHAWDAAFACTTGSEDRVLTLGNPTSPDGRFYRAHQPGSDWHSVKIEASDVPNVREGETVVPGLLTRQGVKRFASEYGEGSPFYQARVRAEFPEEATDALIRREWIDAAMSEERRNELREEGRHSRIVVGVDPARLGPDRTVMAVRQGPVVHGFESWQGADTQESAERVYEEVEGLIEDRGGVKSVVVDEVGLGGGVLDRLNETLSDLTYYHQTTGRRPKLRKRSPRATGFTAGSTAPNSDRFRDVKAQAYWRLRSELEDGRLALPADEGLREELLQTRVEFTADGKTKIEAKDRIKSRIGRSPDLADALSMTFAEDLKSNDRQEFWFA